MIDQGAIEQIQKAPVAERILVIEQILQSLKRDVKHLLTDKTDKKPFKVRQFNLGEDVRVDRDTIHIERNLKYVRN